MNLDVQSADSPTVVTEVTGHDMISGAGLRSMQGYIHTCITNVESTTNFNFWGGGVGVLQRRISSIISVHVLN